jgi:hypothetical protein
MLTHTPENHDYIIHRLLSPAHLPEVDLGMPPPACDMKIASGPPSTGSGAKERLGYMELSSSELVC